MKLKLEDLKEKLNDSDYTKAFHSLKYLLEKFKINSAVIKMIFSLDSKLIIADFLEKYDDFDDKELELITKYINQNMYNDDKMFVSDLIDFARIWGLSLEYNACLELINEKNNDYIVSSLVSYIGENIRTSCISVIIEKFDEILSNNNYFQDSQVRASFFLYRYTHHQKYLDYLIDILKNGQSSNKDLLKSILDIDYNKDKYFNIPSILCSL